MVHQNSIKLTDIGLSKRIEVSTKQQSQFFGGVTPYIDPKMFKKNNYTSQQYTLNEKSDVYSVGMLLWEISNGEPPFKDKQYDVNLIDDILEGLKETIVPGTPEDYTKLYTGKYSAWIRFY